MAKKPNIDDFRKICVAKGGIISGIATTFKSTRKAVYDWCIKDERFQEAIDDAREAFLDTAETQLQVLVKGVPKIIENEKGEKEFAGWQVPPSESAIIFSLRTLGRKRGYTERHEVDATANLNVSVGEVKIDDWIKVHFK
jgi:hypothetical protein